MKYLITVTMLMIVVVVTAACGSKSPTSPTGQFVQGNTNPALMTVTVKFPTRPAAYIAPQPLISASTLAMAVNVFSTTGVLVGSGAVYAPPAGGTASTTIKIYQYQGPVYMDIVGYNSSTIPSGGMIVGYIGAGSKTGYIRQNGLTSTFGVNTPVSVVFIEGDQGVPNITGMNMVSPDGTTYIINDLFLLYTGTVQSYELAAKLTNASTGAITYKYSGQNTDWVSLKSTSFITDASTTLSLQAYAADGKTWNRYDYNLNFAPGGIPTNTPTITQTFMGTIANLNGTGANNYAISWTGSQYILGGENGVLRTSPDAISWTSRVNPVAWNAIRAIASGSNKLIAVGNSGVTLTSPDGITWTSIFVTTWGLTDVLWTGTQYITIDGSLSGGTATTSPDTITWTGRFISPPFTYLNGVAYSPTLPKYVIVGAGGMIGTSSDSITWFPTASTANNLNKVTWSGTQFVAVGDIGTIITSSDAVTWTLRTSGVANNLNKIIWSGTQFVAVGDAGTIITSPDAITWTPQVSGTTNILRDIVWTGTQYVACGDGGITLSSPTGTAWTLRNVWSQGSNFTLPTASWSNYVAPPPPNVQTVVF